MVHRVALALASVAAAAALTIALAAAGFGPGAAVSTPAAPVVQSDVAPGIAPTAQPEIVYDDVYVKPAPPPETIVVRTTRGTGGEHETEHEEHESEGSDG